MGISATRAPLRGVAGVHGCHPAPLGLSLVTQEGPELREAPGVQAATEPLTRLLRLTLALSDARKLRSVFGPQGSPYGADSGSTRG